MAATHEENSRLEDEREAERQRVATQEYNEMIRRNGGKEE